MVDFKRLKVWKEGRKQTEEKTVKLNILLLFVVTHHSLHPSPTPSLK